MEDKKLIAAQDFILTSEKALRSAKKILKELLDEKGISSDSGDDLDIDLNGLNSYKSSDDKIIEGVFTGEDMIGVDNHRYPVPVNYASKSKLVQGDKLKLTIGANGKMLYKQIQLIERETKIGVLTKDKGKYVVLSDGQYFNVLTAAVTHYKAEVGDNITIVIPEGKKATFAAIELVIPKV